MFKGLYFEHNLNSRGYSGSTIDFEKYCYYVENWFVYIYKGKFDIPFHFENFEFKNSEQFEDFYEEHQEYSYEEQQEYLMKNLLNILMKIHFSLFMRLLAKRWL